MSDLATLDPAITMAHGAGGPAMRELIAQLFVSQRHEPPASTPRAEHGLAAEHPQANGHAPLETAREIAIGLDAMDDGAAIALGDGRYLVLTTDSHVVQPRFFPGGDIGRLAVAGTVNDLAMMGATEPLALTCSVILEEGFPLAELRRVQESMAATCAEAGAVIVTGDTKVMGRGEVDGLLLNTAGIALTTRVVPDRGLRPGDRLIVTGTVGDHGLAILSVRRGLGLAGALRSDAAPINGLVRAALAAGGAGIVAMKDPTRGGLAAALHEMAGKSGVGILLDEPAVPVSDAVRAAGELLGIDPLHVANEGKAVLAVRPEVADDVLQALRTHPLGRQAAIVGTATAARVGRVVLDTGFGHRLLAEPDGELLPRIC
jgi:hydrogenase expression/formation protein HypE